MFMHSSWQSTLITHKIVCRKITALKKSTKAAKLILQRAGELISGFMLMALPRATQKYVYHKQKVTQ